MMRRIDMYHDLSKEIPEDKIWRVYYDGELWALLIPNPCLHDIERRNNNA